MTGLLALLVGASLANGVSSHLWITEEAREQVPPGALADFLRDDALWPLVRAGSIFPDGGYAVGHPYGEAAHWEPFHRAYLAWIFAEYVDPTVGEGRQHLAFLMGMVSHGTADQVYDGLYLERAEQAADGDPDVSVDEATDVCMVAEVGPREVPEAPVPAEALVQVLASQGIDASPTDLQRGQAAVQLAVLWVGGAASDPGMVQEYAAAHPWACAHQLDLTADGSPPHEARVVAAMWEQVWARATGGVTAPVLATFPEDGGWEHPTDPELVESWVSTVFSTSLLREDVAAAIWTVEADGHAIPAEPWLYYRDHSHLVHLVPQEPWAADATHHVTVTGLVDAWGEPVPDVAWSFSTATAPVEGPAPAELSGGCTHTAPTRWALAVLPLLAISRRRRS